MITATLHQKDITEGRFKVRQLMKKAELCSNQPGVHSYKITTTERSDIPNKLARDLKQFNQIKYGRVTLLIFRPVNGFIGNN